MDTSRSEVPDHRARRPPPGRGCGPYPARRLPEPGRADRLGLLRTAAFGPAAAVERALHRDQVQGPPGYADPRPGPVRPHRPAAVSGGDRMRYVGRGGYSASAPAPRDLPGHRPPGPRASGAPLHPLANSGHAPPRGADGPGGEDGGIRGDVPRLLPGRTDSGHVGAQGTEGRRAPRRPGHHQQLRRARGARRARRVLHAPLRPGRTRRRVGGRRQGSPRRRPARRPTQGPGTRPRSRHAGRLLGPGGFLARRPVHAVPAGRPPGRRPGVPGNRRRGTARPRQPAQAASWLVHLHKEGRAGC